MNTNIIDQWASYCHRRGIPLKLYLNGCDVIMERDQTGQYCNLDYYAGIGFDGLARSVLGE
jgi:hypothetical protein